MKSTRQQKILELIATMPIGTQEALQEALAKAGYEATQATISRDIKELRLSKISINGVKQYTITTTQSRHLGDKYTRVLRDGFVSMDMAQNILVIKTVAGMAMAVAASLDQFGYDEIVGTIAGDDTIMCAIRTVEETKELMDKIERMIAQN